MPVVTTYEALLSGLTWNGVGISGRPVFITYSFDRVAPAYLSGYFPDPFLNSFRSFTEAEQAIARDALRAWSEISGVTFFEVPEGRGDIRFGTYDFQHGDPEQADSRAFAFYPFVFDFPDGVFEDPAGGDVFIDIGEVTFEVLAHELGHALGLKHPFEGETTLDPGFDDRNFTIMSYRPVTPLPTGLGVIDPEAMQHMYGPASADGTQVASWSWDAAELVLRQTGGPAADRIAGVGVSDLIAGGSGDDYVFSRAGEDRLDGEAGDDTLSGGDDADTLTGGSGSDELNGDGGDDSISGGDGDDDIWGFEGFNRISAGAGNDVVHRGRGIVAADGGEGFDELEWILPVGAPATLMSYATLAGAGGSFTGFERTFMWGDRDADTLVGGALVDELLGDGGDDTIVGAEGDDLLFGGSGADTLSAGPGADTLSGGSGANYLRGDEGSDSVQGGSGFDDINGNMGDDTASGGDGDDWVVGGKDSDSLSGGAGGDLVYGNLGADTLEGGSGNDIVRGGQDADVLNGGDGDDYVSGDKGDDTVSGGGGADLFHTFGDAGLDHVLDFRIADGDRVLLDPGTTYATAQVGADVVISMGGGGRMVLVGVQLSSLTGDWIFGA